ncbi:MAG TPA: histidine phosphatase family protein [Steroidobacteraceae bacterium]|nr:histidine phosphatase family protein [Steroidobacteraceae bacterium]
MVRLLLIRHAPAFDRDRQRWPDDRQRPLTPEGIAKFRKAAAGLGRLVESVDRLLTSPLVRTRETAALLSRLAGWPEALEAPELAPERTTAQVLKLVREQRGETIALVGHEPNLAELLAVSVIGAGASLGCELKKGGTACLSFAADARPGQARLEWLLTPKVLRALAGDAR